MIAEKRSLLRIFVGDFFRRNESPSIPSINHEPNQADIIMIRAVVIIHDPVTMQQTTATLASMCTNVEVIEKCDSIKTGIAAINASQPDIVILEIQLADGSGFDLLKHFGKPDFKLIIISAYMEYAVKAIKYNASDFLVKPFEAEELVMAVNKTAEQISYEEKLQFKHLENRMKSLTKVDRITLKTSDQLYLVNIADIIYVEAYSNYSTFYLEKDKKLLVLKSLREFEEILLDKGFFRIHKTYLVNVNKMNHFDKKDGGFVIMSNGVEIPVASRKREMLLGLFEEMG
jgi:two-component system, LytTR family, response regulator